MSDRFEDLNESQKRLLREVANGRSSKEMSREVGLEPGTIDVYLSQAIRSLGVADRFEAARAFAEYESGILSRSELRAEALASSAEPEQSHGRRKVGTTTQILHLPPLGGREHDYTLSQRITAALKIAGLGFVVVIAISIMISFLFWAFPKP